MKLSFAQRAFALACLNFFCAGAQAAVSLSMSSSNLNPIAGGAAFNYVITLNNDAVGATNVVLVNRLPNDANFLNLSIGGSNPGLMSCEGPAAASPGTVVCEVASLPGNASMTITIVANFRPDMSGGARTNQARLASGGVSTAQVVQTVINDANVLTNSTEWQQGSLFVRNIEITVNGNSSAEAVSITTPLPNGASIESLRGTGPLSDTCYFNPLDRNIRCNAQDVPTGIHKVTLVYDLVDMLFRNGFE